MAIKKQQIIKGVVTSLWVAIGAGVLLLLIAAMQKKNAALCSAVEVEIKGVSNNFFIDESDVKNLIQKECGGNPKGKPVKQFNLKKLESSLEKEVWIKHAELFFDNNGVLKAIIDEREPVARIFSTSGATFYIDSSTMILPMSEKFSARLPVFTNFPSDAKVLTAADSSLLNGINHLSQLILADSFLMGMIDQVDITAKYDFEIIPKIGKQVIVFGNANNAETKFNKLKLFYKNIMLKAGWNRYSSINLQYNNQVVAKLRNKEDILADSLRTLQLLQIMADHAAAMASDSSLAGQSAEGMDKPEPANDIIQHSFEREDDNNPQELQEKNQIQQNITTGNVDHLTSEPTKPAVVATTTQPVKPAKPAIKPVPLKTKPQSKPIIKPPGNILKKADSGKKPKAIMPANP